MQLASSLPNPQPSPLFIVMMWRYFSLSFPAEMANAYANMLRDAAEEFFTCNGMTRFTSATATAAMTTAATTSAATTGGHGIAQATPLLPLLMAVLCIVGFAKH